MAIAIGAVLVGLAAVAFARLADAASGLFDRLITENWWLPLLITPAIFAVIAWTTRRFAPSAAGSGIPQVIAARSLSDPSGTQLASMRTASVKTAMTALGLASGASIGREGPTVQIGASLMALTHRILRVPVKGSVLIAGAAAGVAAAFNTPLAGVAFAIEELAVAYEQRMTLLVMTAVLLAGMISLGINGDYLYFGLVGTTLSVSGALLVCPLAGCVGGLAGGLFSRAMLWLARGGAARIARGHAVSFAALCGLLVGVIGIASGGLTWGTGYTPARAIIEGAAVPAWYGAAKAAATLISAAAGLPGGIFAPSLSTGAGLGHALQALLPSEPAGPVVLMGMVGYFVGVVRAPLTSVIIIAETTGSRGLMLPLLATALIAEFVASQVSHERLYHGLARNYLKPDEGDRLPSPGQALKAT